MEEKLIAILRSDSNNELSISCRALIATKRNFHSFLIPFNCFVSETKLGKSFFNQISNDF